MNYYVKARIFVPCLTCILAIGLATAVSNEAPKPRRGDSYVQIYDGKISYIPRTAESVKINGQVRRIVKFATTLSKEEEECKCPKCCQGSCYVIVFTDSILLNKPIIVLGIIWVSCT
jgi:hypothetical protein